MLIQGIKTISSYWNSFTFYSYKYL